MSFIGFLVAAGSLNDAQTALATTGVLLFRGLTYLMPLPLGVVTYLTWSLKRRHNPPASGEPGEGGEAANHLKDMPRPAEESRENSITLNTDRT
jgi:hypothetical protein